ncbi:MAG: hypothetical protein V1798_00810 [Pseudomonadota bacterium]
MARHLSTKTFFLDQLLLIAGLFLLAHRFLWDVVRTPVLGGWDGASHLAMAQEYSRHVWPAVFGWTPHWFLGMPFPNFYHPLFFWFVALLDHVLPFSISTIIKLLALFLTFTLPTLFYLLGTLRLGGRRPALIGGLLAVYLLTRGGFLASWGLTLLGTFQIGLYAHLLSFWLLLLFFCLLPEPASSRGKYRALVVLLTLVLLANVNVLVPLLLTYAAFFGMEWLGERERGFRAVFRPYFTIGLWSLGLSAFWYVPMLATYGWVATKPLILKVEGHLAAGEWAWLLLGLISIPLAFRKKHRFALPIGLGVAGSLLLIPVADRVFAGAPFQVHRVVITCLFLMIPLLAFGIVRLLEFPASRHLRIAVGFLIFFLLVGFPYLREPDGLFQSTRISQLNPAEYADLVAEGRNPSSGRYTVESVDFHSNVRGRYDEAAYLNGLIGNGGGFGISTVYREASLASFFTDSVRNIYSQTRYPIWGITSQLSSDPDFWNQPMEEHRKRNRLLNLKTIYVHMPTMAHDLRAAKGFRQTLFSHQWTVFKDEADMSVYAHVPRFKPFLVYARWEPKKRASFGDYDFLSLAEYSFFSNQEDPPLVLSPEERLDSPMDWSRFGGLIVTDFRYRDLNAACGRVSAFAKERPVLFLDQDSPLEACVIRTAGSDRVAVVTPYRSDETEESLADKVRSSYPGSTGETWGPVMAARTLELRRRFREPMGRILDWAQEHRTPVDSAVRVRNAELGRDRSHVTLDRAPGVPVPVILHQTYFPRWFQGENPVLLVSPCYQLVFTDRRELDVRFRRTWVEHAAGALSALVLILALGAVWARSTTGRSRATRWFGKPRSEP